MAFGVTCSEAAPGGRDEGERALEGALTCLDLGPSPYLGREAR